MRARWQTVALMAVVLSNLALVIGCEGPYRRGDREREEEFRARCHKIIDRIEVDRAKIDEIDPTQHPRARQWYIDDLHNAERDLDRCREGD